jgi:transcription initiation factor TFIID TATA-box-binding protein
MSWQIVNVVATADIKQHLDLHTISKLPNSIHDPEIYGGRVAYLKTPEMRGKVTLFPSGKLISIGTKSIEQAQLELSFVSKLLSDANLIKPIEVKANLRNIVALLTLSDIILLEDLVDISGIIYEPDQFPGAILKGEQYNATYLIFQSGKIVISGTNSSTDLEKSVIYIKKLLSKYSS